MDNKIFYTKIIYIYVKKWVSNFNLNYKFIETVESFNFFNSTFISSSLNVQEEKKDHDNN